MPLKRTIGNKPKMGNKPSGSAKADTINVERELINRVGVGMHLDNIGPLKKRVKKVKRIGSMRARY